MVPPGATKGGLHVSGRFGDSLCRNRTRSAERVRFVLSTCVFAGLHDWS
jgi:hypothetical protein